MPTILRKNGFEIRIYTNDHLPSHVHVFKAEGEARISIGSETEAPDWISISPKMSERDAIRALELVADNQKKLLEAWKEIHGQENSSSGKTRSKSRPKARRS